MKSFKLFAEQASPMINPPKNEFDNKKDVVEGDRGAKYQIKSIGKDSRGEYYISPSTGKKVYKSGVNKGDHENPKTGNITAKVVKEDEDMVSHVKEAGPFSYGTKPPRKGSVAYNALIKRKEHEKNKPPIEPKDQMVGTAKVVKEDQELKAAVDRRDQNRKKYGFSKAEKIYANEFDKIMAKRYGKAKPIPARLSDKDIQENDKKVRFELDPNRPFDPDKPKKNHIAKPGKYGQGYSIAKHLAKQGMAKGLAKEENDPREYDYEGDMARSDLRSIINNAKEIHDMLEDNTNLAEWVQSKITLAEDYISTVRNYMKSENEN